MKPLKLSLALAASMLVSASFAAEYPKPQEADWIAKDFKFHTGEILPEVRLHYTTVGQPTGEPVLWLHGTYGSAATLLTPAFAGELLAPVRSSTPRNTTSSSPTPWAAGSRPGRRTA